MELETVRHIIERQWVAEVKDRPFTPRPEAKFITGNLRDDTYLHYLETECGIRLLLTTDCKNVIGYRVIDEEKFTWFVLKWL